MTVLTRRETSVLLNFGILGNGPLDCLTTSRHVIR